MNRGPWKRMLIMTEGHMGRYDSKAAAGIIRYCPGDVVGILDSHRAGQDIRPVLGVGAGLPVVPDVASALRSGQGHLSSASRPQAGLSRTNGGGTLSTP